MVSSILYLSGTVDLTLDDKFRLTMPTRYRKILEEECDGQCVLTLSLFDKCLWLYPKVTWDELLASLSSVKNFGNPKLRALKRVILGSSVSFKTDAQGRFLVPKNLRDFASFSKNVTLVGIQNKFELWDKELYNAQMQQDLETLEDIRDLVDQITNIDTLNM